MCLCVDGMLAPKSPSVLTSQFHVRRIPGIEQGWHEGCAVDAFAAWKFAWLRQACELS